MTYDIQRLSSALEAAFLKWRAGEDIFMRRVVERELTAYKKKQLELFVAISNAGAPVGTVALVWNHADPDLADGRTIAYVQALEVDASQRRQGLGRALMQHLETAASQRGYRKLTLMVETDNTAALELYAGLGYRAFKRSVWHWKGRNYPTLCLEKTLP